MTEDSSVGPRPNLTSSPEYASPSLEVLQELEVANTLTRLEGRLEAIEDDITRLTSGRDEESQRTEGELAVMRARVDDALEAMGETSRELRDAWRSVDKRLLEMEAGPGEGVEPRLLASLAGQVVELRAAILRLAEHMAASVGLAGRMADLELQVAELSARLGRPFDL